MALNLNRIEVIGNLTRDPELRYTPNGQAVASFAVATNRRYQDKTGNWVDAEAEFHEVVVWAKLAEAVNKTIKKGDRVFVTGRVQTQSWEGQDGNRRTKTEIVADTVFGPDVVARASYESNSGPTVANSSTSTPATPTPATPTPSPTPVAPSPTPSPTPATPTSPVENSTPNPATSDDEIDREDIPF